MSITSSSTPLRIGKVSLTVRDLEKVIAFYQTTLGLSLVDKSDGIAQLGAGGQAFLELVGDSQALQSSPRDAGLFHTAFLLPTRADLGRWIGHAAANRIALQGASDHAVSEALYLADPEGNGIEIYTDRPSEAWPMRDGSVAMTTERLDTDSLLEAAAGTQWNGAPDGTIVGHVHLQVGETDQADAFYSDGLGLEITTRYPGASFYGSGGYHHHLAGNIWKSRHAGKRPARSTGLRNVELLAADAGTLDTVKQSLAAAQIATDTQGDTIMVEDPWGSRLSLRHKAR